MKRFIHIWMSAFFGLSIQAQNEFANVQTANTFEAFNYNETLTFQNNREKTIVSFELTSNQEESDFSSQLFPSKEEIEALFAASSKEVNTTLLTSVPRLSFYTGNAYLNDRKMDGKRWTFKSVQFRFKLSSGNDPSKLFKH